MMQPYDMILYYVIVVTAVSKPVNMQSNHSYSTAIRQDNVELVAMQSNPAYGGMVGGKVAQL